MERVDMTEKEARAFVEMTLEELGCRHKGETTAEWIIRTAKPSKDTWQHAHLTYDYPGRCHSCGEEFAFSLNRHGFCRHCWEEACEDMLDALHSNVLGVFDLDAWREITDRALAKYDEEWESVRY